MHNIVIAMYIVDSEETWVRYIANYIMHAATAVFNSQVATKISCGLSYVAIPFHIPIDSCSTPYDASKQVIIIIDIASVYAAVVTS